MGYICHNVMIALLPDEAAAADAFAQLSRHKKLAGHALRAGRLLALPSDGSKEGWEESANGDERRRALARALPKGAPWADFLLGGDSGEEGPDSEHPNPDFSYGQRDYSSPALWPESGFEALALAAVGMDYPPSLRQGAPGLFAGTADLSDLAARWESLFPGRCALSPERNNGYRTAILLLEPSSREEALLHIARAIDGIGDTHFCAMALSGGDWSMAAGSFSFSSEIGADLAAAILAAGEREAISRSSAPSELSAPRLGL